MAMICVPPRYHDSRQDAQKAAVLTQADLAKTLLPLLLESAREALRWPSSSAARGARDLYFDTVEQAVRGILEAFRGSGQVEAEGEAVQRMDRLFLLAESGGPEDVEEARHLVDGVLRHALSVAKAAPVEDDRVIGLACRRLLADLASVPAQTGGLGGLGGLGDPKTGGLGGLGDALELLEQRVNTALLRMAIGALSR